MGAEWIDNALGWLTFPARGVPQSRLALPRQGALDFGSLRSRARRPDDLDRLFDMNDVLRRYDREARVDRLARARGKTPSFVEAAIWGSGYEDLALGLAIDARRSIDGPRFQRRARGGRFGHLTIRRGQNSGARSLSLAETRPRTETPASCTLSGEPETSGCQSKRSRPSATSR
jgi:hypothetical protein